MEEPRITPITVNDFKELLGGSPFDIHVKHQEDVRLDRLPVLISTNCVLTQYCTNLDAEAINKRCKVYIVSKEIGPDKEVYDPPGRLCTCHFAYWYSAWLNGWKEANAH